MSIFLYLASASLRCDCSEATGPSLDKDRPSAHHVSSYPAKESRRCEPVRRRPFHANDDQLSVKEREGPRTVHGSWNPEPCPR